MTLVCWARPRRFPHLPPPERRFFDVADDARVLAHCHWQPARHERPTILALHGLEGSSEAHYVRGVADKAWRAGFNVVRLNQRNCGGTEHLSRGLYHSGLSADPAFVLHELATLDRLPAIVVAGYSLGGNLAMKLAGDFGGAPPPQLAAVCAVSPTLELARCVDALERPGNAIYQWNFVRNLKRRMRSKIACFPQVYDPAPLASVKTVREFDEAYTAPFFGFQSASDYYHRASAMRVAHRISVPALVISAANDPFVPPEQFDEPAVTTNPWIHLVVTDDGGHCGFLSESPNGGGDAYWAEHAIVAFASAACARLGVPPVPGGVR